MTISFSVVLFEHWDGVMAHTLLLFAIIKDEVGARAGNTGFTILD